MKTVTFILFIFSIPLVLSNIDSTIREGRYANPRNMQAKWKHENRLDGVFGDNFLKTNKLGLKGDAFGNEELRVLVIGNSLVEGPFLDQTEIWTQVLQDELRKKGLDIKVFNASKSGSISARRFVDVYEAYERYKFDLVILYPMARYNSKYSETEGFSEYYVPDYKNKELSFRNNTIFQILRNRKWEFASYVKRRFGFDLFKNAIVNPDHITENYRQAQRRKSLPIFNMTDEYLEDYRSNFIKGSSLVVNYFNQKRVPLVILDRLHVASMNPKEKDLELWWGDTVNDQRISIEDYKRILMVEHEALKDLEGKGVSFLPQSEIKATAGWFFDQQHFNELGSKNLALKLAPVVLEALKSR